MPSQGAPTPPTPPAPPAPGDPTFSGQGPDLGDQAPNIVIPESLGEAMQTGMQVLLYIVILLVVVWPLVRLFVRRVERRMVTYQLPPEVDARLTRIEQGVDSIAIEIERVSEAQRFSAKLMAEREGGGAGRAPQSFHLPDPDR